MTPRPAEQAAQMRRGRIFTWLGIGMIGAGALILPITQSHGQQRSTIVPALSLMTGGSGLASWGAQEKRRATRPHTTVGVLVGRINGIQVRRDWSVRRSRDTKRPALASAPVCGPLFCIAEPPASTHSVQRLGR